jgi:hypothetical protein
VVRKLQSYVALGGLCLPSSATSGYCQARQKLSLDELEGILQRTAARLEPSRDGTFLQGRRVLVVDGTGLSMPDTPSNQQVWPQQRSQIPGRGLRRVLPDLWRVIELPTR